MVWLQYRILTSLGKSRSFDNRLHEETLDCCAFFWSLGYMEDFGRERFLYQCRPIHHSINHPTVHSHYHPHWCKLKTQDRRTSLKSIYAFTLCATPRIFHRFFSLRFVLSSSLFLRKRCADKMTIAPIDSTILQSCNAWISCRWTQSNILLLLDRHLL